MAVAQLPDGRWVVYYRRRGEDGKSRIKREYFGRGLDAETKARQRDSELALLPRRPRPQNLGPSFLKIAKVYFQSHQFASHRAKDQCLNRLEARVLPHFGPISAIRIDDNSVDEYIRKRRESGVKFATIRRELVDVKAILNFAARRRPALIPFNPIATYRLPKEDLAVILPPTAEEFAAIMKHACEHLRRIMLLAYYLGLRPGPVECYRLTWDAVDWSAGVVLVTSARKGGRDRRIVPIHQELLPHLITWHALDSEAGIPWIIHYCGKPPVKISTAWENALEAAGIKRRIRPYDIRHLFVTKVLRAGGDVKALAEVVGSAPQTLIKFYQHVSQEQHRELISLITAAPSPGDTGGDTNRKTRMPKK